MRVFGAVVGVLFVAGVVLMFVTGMVLSGVLVVAVAFGLLMLALGWAVSAGSPTPGRLLVLVPFVAAAFAVGVGVCAVAGLFAANTDAYIWARGTNVQLEVPQMGPGFSFAGGNGMCDQAGSAVGGGEWSCGLSWEVDGKNVDGTAALSDADMDSHGDTVPGRALGSSAVSVRVGQSRAASQVVLGDIPGWAIPAAFGAAILLAVGGSALARRIR